MAHLHGWLLVLVVSWEHGWAVDPSVYIWLSTCLRLVIARCFNPVVRYTRQEMKFPVFEGLSLETRQCPCITFTWSSSHGSQLDAREGTHSPSFVPFCMGEASENSRSSLIYHRHPDEGDFVFYLDK